MKTSNYLVLCFLAFGLIACNGQNPFTTGSNPVKDYPSANDESAVPYVAGEVQQQPVGPDNSQSVCLPPMHVAISPEHGNMLMLFNEEQTSTYRITVLNRAGVDYDISSSLPLTLVQKTIDSATFDFTWTPEKSRGTRLVSKTLEITYTYKNQHSATLCGDATVAINLVVDKSALQPSLRFIDLASTVPFSTNGVAFSIEVDDPASTSDYPPVLSEFTYRSQGNTGRRTVLDASTAVECGEPTLADGTRWLFNCTFTASQVVDIEAQVTAGAQAITTFSVTAVSTRNVGISSLLATATIGVTP